MITLDEALRLGRAYGLSLTDVKALREMTADLVEAKHVAIRLGGSDAERSDEAYALEREQRDAEHAVENTAFAAYRDANPKPSKPARVPVAPVLHDYMTARERTQATEDAHEANVKADAAELSDATQQRSRDYYDWAAAGKPEK